MSTTGFSDTDLRLFSELSNPNKTNLTRLRDDRFESRIEEVPQEEGQFASIFNDDESVSSVASHKSQASQKSQVSRASTHHSEASKVSSHPPMSYKSSVASGVSSHVPSKTNSSRKPSAYDAFMMQRKAAIQAPPPVLRTEMPVQMSSEYEVLEKQSVLLDLERLKLQGVSLTKSWTMQDRLEDMQFEMRRHTLHVEEMNNVTMMRDAMRMLCTGVEMLSTKTGVLNLQGWSGEVCTDMHKYDSALSRLYRKYWRKSHAATPEMELAMGIIGSIGMFHFKNKFSAQFMPNMGMPNMGMPNMSGDFPKPTPGSSFGPAVESYNTDSDEEAPP